MVGSWCSGPGVEPCRSDRNGRRLASDHSRSPALMSSRICNLFTDRSVCIFSAKYIMNFGVVLFGL